MRLAVPSPLIPFVDPLPLPRRLLEQKHGAGHVGAIGMLDPSELSAPLDPGGAERASERTRPADTAAAPEAAHVLSVLTNLTGLTMTRSTSNTMCAKSRFRHQVRMLSSLSRSVGFTPGLLTEQTAVGGLLGVGSVPWQAGDVHEDSSRRHRRGSGTELMGPPFVPQPQGPRLSAP